MSAIYKTVYSRFKGIDKAHPETEVAAERSPYAPNMVSGADGFPEKRLGWRVLANLGGKIYAVTAFSVEGSRYLICHAGTKVFWGLPGQPMTAIEGISLSEPTGEWDRTQFFSFGGKLYLIGGGNYITFDWNEGAFFASYVRDNAYVPTVLISRDPSGGGTAYEGVNMLSGRRKVDFLADGTSKEYQLPQTELKSVDAVNVAGVDKAEGTDYTVDLEKGTVTFSEAPPKADTYEGYTTGQDTVFITYTYENPEYIAKIENCSMAAVFGTAGADRLFLSGNPEYQNMDWHSGYMDASYFPDRNYTSIGNETTAVMGYAHVGKYLAVIKEENNSEGTIFLRSYAVDNEGEPYFPIEQSITGVGMIARQTVANIDDEPLFLSRNGIYAIIYSTYAYALAERRVQNRSWYINNDIIRDTGLQNAVAAAWDNRYILCTEQNTYVLDGNQAHSYVDKTNGDYVYECYEWNGIPAFSLCSDRGNLYFGTADGRLCKFNSDVENLSRFSDGGTMNEDGFVTGGIPIKATWATKMDDDGDFTRTKTMIRHGCGLMIKPYSRSSAKVKFRTENDFGIEAFVAALDIFDWEYIDFSRFSFNSNDAPRVVPFLWHLRRYVTLQIIIENETIDEGFGLLGIIKSFCKDRFVPM